MDGEKKEAETPKSPEEDFWMTAAELDPAAPVKERFEQIDFTLPEEDELAAIGMFGNSGPLPGKPPDRGWKGRQLMARSRKKAPVYKDGSSSPGNPGKRYANRRVRRWRGTFPRQRGRYRRLYESWDICDYSFYLPWRQAEREGWSREKWARGYCRK